MDVLISLGAFVVAIGVIISVHEAGHLLVAKAFDVRVLAFSIGFGKRLWGFTRGETEYKIALLPLGGYVKMGGEMPDEISEDPRDFLNKPRWQRVLIYLAGPAMNVLLAIVLIAGVFMVGIERLDLSLSSVPPVVGEVVEGSSAQAAGVRAGDEVLRADGDEVDSWEDLLLALATRAERPVELTLRRGAETLTATVTPASLDQSGVGDTAGLVPRLHPRISQVFDDSPAAAAGFAVGDEIHAVDGQAVTGGQELVDYISRHAGTEIAVEVEREGRRLVLPVTPGGEQGAGRIGVGLGYYQRYGPARAVVESLRYNGWIVQQTFVVLGKIFTRDIPAKAALSGPIEIAKFSGREARAGLKNLIFFMGVISISIAILNLLPIPVLDGGQIFLLAIEGTLRRDLSMRLKERINHVGFVLLMLLMLMVIFFDLQKNLPPGLLPGS